MNAKIDSMIEKARTLAEKLDYMKPIYLPEADNVLDRLYNFLDGNNRF